MINKISLSDDEQEFLRESNAIEDIKDEDSFIQACYAWEYLIAQKALTHHVILKTHKILMLHQKIRPDQRGYYRQKNVKIGHYELWPVDGGNEWIKHFVETGKTLNHKDIRSSMDQWLYIANKVDTADWPEEWAKQSHIQFEVIHPFIDGNGRLGRMLLNWERLKAKCDLLIIYEKDRQKYYKWFNI